MRNRENQYSVRHFFECRYITIMRSIRSKQEFVLKATEMLVQNVGRPLSRCCVNVNVEAACHSITPCPCVCMCRVHLYHIYVIMIVFVGGPLYAFGCGIRAQMPCSENCNMTRIR